MSDFLTVFTRASKLMRGAADQAFSRHGLRVGQNLVLEALWERDGLTPGEIGRQLHVTTPTVVKMATRLEAAGFLARRRDPTDARLVRLDLTNRGRAVKGAIEREQAQLEERATAGLSASARAQLERTLARVVENLEPVAPLEEPELEA